MRPLRASDISCLCLNSSEHSALTIKNKIEVGVAFTVTLHVQRCSFNICCGHHVAPGLWIAENMGSTFCIGFRLMLGHRKWLGEAFTEKKSLSARGSVRERMVLNSAREGRKEYDEVRNTRQLLVRVHRETLLKCRLRQDCWKSCIIFSNVHIFSIYQ